jgi:hypothetical protein
MEGVERLLDETSYKTQRLLINRFKEKEQNTKLNDFEIFNEIIKKLKSGLLFENKKLNRRKTVRSDRELMSFLIEKKSSMIMLKQKKF